MGGEIEEEKEQAWRREKPGSISSVQRRGYRQFLTTSSGRRANSRRRLLLGELGKSGAPGNHGSVREWKFTDAHLPPQNASAVCSDEQGRLL